MSLTVAPLDPAQIRADLPDLAALRITVFRDWPYLYDGSAAYEERYPAPYTDSPAARVAGAWDGDRLVGAATATPLEDHADGPVEGWLKRMEAIGLVGEVVLTFSTAHIAAELTKNWLLRAHGGSVPWAVRSGDAL